MSTTPSPNSASLHALARQIASSASVDFCSFIGELARTGNDKMLAVFADAGAPQIALARADEAPSPLDVVYAAMPILSAGVTQARLGILAKWCEQTRSGVDLLNEALALAMNDVYVHALVALGAAPNSVVKQPDGKYMTVLAASAKRLVPDGVVTLLGMMAPQGEMPMAALPDGSPGHRGDTGQTFFQYLLKYGNDLVGDRILPHIAVLDLPLAWRYAAGEAFLQRVGEIPFSLAGNPALYWALSLARFSEKATWLKLAKQTFAYQSDGFPAAFAYGARTWGLKVLQHMLADGVLPDEIPVSISNYGAYEGTLLHAAVLAGDAPAVQLLLAAGADASRTLRVIGEDPAAKFGGKSAVEAAAELAGGRFADDEVEQVAQTLRAWQARKSLRDVAAASANQRP